MSRGGTRVYFGRLPRDVRERDIEKLIRGYGSYREISIKLGYGFVEFYESNDADDCVYDLNGKELLGERIVVEHARNPVRSVDYGYRSRDNSNSNYSSGGGRSNRREPPRRGRTPPVRTEHRLAVMNLSSRCNWQDLKEYMGKAGEVTFADAHKRRQGEGVVEFSSKDDMKTAMKKLDDTEFFGRRITLKIEKVKTRRSTSRSRSRSHSRSRRRSHSRSRSPKRRRRSSSPHRSRSKHSRSHSASKSPSKDKAHSKSRSKSPEEKSRSPSPIKDQENGEEEVKDVDEVDEEAEEDQPEQVEENGDDENGEEENMADVDDADKKEADAEDDGDGDEA
ncbi:hypothetical protein QZH41_011328 [Actinostola sp. cb2023]|nr:hypothetical protein QZH41_011328 [Actinostola sp. cb2023]